MQDYGIEYTEYYDIYENKFISGACITNEGHLLLCENYNIVNKLIRDEESGTYHVQKIDYIKREHIKSIAELFGDIFILDEKTKSIFKYDTKGMETELFSLEDYYDPLFLYVSKYGIAVSCLPSCLFHFSNNVLRKIDLSFVIEPIHVEQKDSDVFLITDCLGHIVYEVNENGQICWSFGVKDNPGWYKNNIYMPMCAVYGYEDDIYIAEQRNHRIIRIDREGHQINEYGRCLQVGLNDGKLWAPNYVLISRQNKCIYAVLSKSGTVVEIAKNMNTTIYGYNMIEYSIFNFQRSCEWNENLRRLLIADTGHNRVLIMDEIGNIVKEFSEFDTVPLRFPRCAIWLGDDLIITDSQNKRVLLVNKDYKVKDQWNFADRPFCAGAHWLQVGLIDDRNERLLIATSSIVMIFNLADGEMQWTSDIFDMDLTDIHCVQFDENEIIITDTGNNRIVFVDSCNNVRFLDGINTKEGYCKFKSPRMAKRTPCGLLIVDSGNSKVYLIDDEIKKNVIYCVGKGRGLKRGFFSAPRWACFQKNKLFISDTDNHRIVYEELPV